MDFLLEPPKRMQTFSADTLILANRNLSGTSDLQSYKIVSLCFSHQICGNFCYSSNRNRIGFAFFFFFFEALSSATFFLKGSGVGLWIWVWVVPWCHSPMPHFWDIVGSRDYSMYP